MSRKLLSLGLVAFTLSSGRDQAQDRLPGLVRAGTFAAGARGRILQVATSLPDSGAVYAVGSFPLHPPDLAPGEGRTLAQAYCVVCHSLVYITMQPPLPAAQWEATVTKMRNVHGAQIPDAAAQTIIAYLQANYGDTRRQ